LNNIEIMKKMKSVTVRLLHRHGDGFDEETFEMKRDKSYELEVDLTPEERSKYREIVITVNGAEGEEPVVINHVVEESE
jgi:hypothetical protein